MCVGLNISRENLGVSRKDPIYRAIVKRSSLNWSDLKSMVLMQSYLAGDTSLDVIKVGDFKLLLSHMLKVPETAWRPKYGDLFERGISSPGNCILIRAPGASIMVDPNDFALSCSPDSEYYPSPDYKAPPDLVTQLETISVRPEDITHVVITHAHFDHYAGVTRKTNSGKLEPTFPKELNTIWELRTGKVPW